MSRVRANTVTDFAGTGTPSLPYGIQVGAGATVRGDTNTINLLTNGSERLRITSAGNVGIGIDDPQYKIHVRDTNGSVVSIDRDGGLANLDFIAGLRFGNNDGSGSPPHGTGIKVVADDTFGSAKMHFLSGNRNSWDTDIYAMTIDSDGSIGIGTDNPGNANLAVVSATQAAFSIGQNVDGSGSNHLGMWYGTGADIFTSNGNMSFWVDGAGGSGSSIEFGKGFGAGGGGDTWMTINSSGNIGIGTDNPDSTLHLQASSASTTLTFTAPGTQPNKIQFQLNDGTLDAEIKNELARLIFSTGTTPSERMRIQSDKIMVSVDIKPNADGTLDLGASGTRWDNVYINDIDLSNESKKDTGGNDVDGTWGSYKIQEGENDLFLINRRSGKKYKFNITEVS